MTKLAATLDDTIRRFRMPSTKDGILVQRLDAPSPIPWLWPAGLGAAAAGTAFLEVPGVPRWVVPVVLGASSAGTAAFLWYRRRLRPVHPPLAQAFRGWNDLTRRLRRSPNKYEREHIFLGTIDGTCGAPVLVSDEVTNDHTLTLGGSGTGKTAKDFVPRMVQLILRRQSSLIYLTSKLGDHATFYSVALAAREARLDFRWFSTASDRSSYAFNALNQSHLKALSPGERAEYVIKLAGLDHGPGYGRDWFRDIGTDVLKRLLEAHPLRSFAEIAAKWNEPNLHRALGISRREFTENAAHVRVLVERLARLGPRYNATAASGLPPRVLGAAIDMTDFFRRPQVLYVEVAAQRAPLSASPVGRSFIHAAVDAAREFHGPRVHLDIFADEFKHWLSSDVDSVFKTARDSGVSIAAATQALSDFRTADFDYRPVVLENVRMLNIFRAQDAEGHDLIVRNSGQRTRLLASDGEATNAAGTSRSHQVRETLVPRLDAEEIERVNQDPDLSIISVTPGAGFAQFRPLIMRSYFHIGRREFDRRRRLPWPRPNAFTVAPEPRREPVPNPETPPQGEVPNGAPAGDQQAPAAADPAVASGAAPEPAPGEIQPAVAPAAGPELAPPPDPAAPPDRPRRARRRRADAPEPPDARPGTDPTGEFLQDLFQEREAQP